MVFKHYRVGNKLKSLVQTAICLDVQVFGVRIGDIQQFLSVTVYRAATINLQFNTEMAQALAVKHQIGRVAVFVDNFAVLIPSGRTVGVAIGAVAMDNTVAVLTEPVPSTWYISQSDDLHYSSHKFWFHSLVIPPFRLVNVNTLRQAA